MLEFVKEIVVKSPNILLKNEEISHRYWFLKMLEFEKEIVVVKSPKIKIGDISHRSRFYVSLWKK
jgi:hypothetical protein